MGWLEGCIAGNHNLTIGNTTRSGTILVTLCEHVACNMSADEHQSPYSHNSHDVSSRVNDWRSHDTDIVRNIGASNIRLEEWRVKLSRGDERTGFRVVYPHIVLVRCCDEHFGPSILCVDQRLGEPLLLAVRHLLLPQNTKA